VAIAAGESVAAKPWIECRYVNSSFPPSCATSAFARSGVSVTWFWNTTM